MCGILGAILRENQKEADFQENFNNSLQYLEHRGPDSSGVSCFDNVYFGHTRLSILDLSGAGSQPMVSAGDKHLFTYNGEVYNFNAIKEHHALANVVSTGDSEVVFRALQQVGVSALTEFNGLFAFGYYDRDARKLILARDRAGIKPLYYCHDNHGFYFASEAKCLLNLIDERPDLNPAALSEWVYYGTPLGSHTLFSGIHKVPPGSYLELDVDSFELKVVTYWKPGSARSGSASQSKSRSQNEIISQARVLLENAVKRQLVSDAPLGILLSGGIDSSAIAAFAARNYGKKLSTYTVGFDFKEGVDELATAKKFAAELNTDHHEVHIAGADLPAVIEKMVWHHDQPFADAANIPLYLTCEQLKSELKVVLQGDGGDELFGGYRRYKSLMKIKQTKFLASMFRLLFPLLPKNSRTHALDRYSMAMLEKDTARRMARLITVECPERQPENIFDFGTRDVISQHDPFRRFTECADAYTSESLAQQMLYVDFEIILPDVYLEKVDKSTMAASVEARVPFLDNDLVDFCHSLSAVEKIPKGQQKWLLKKALEGIVPNSILYGPKTGFGVPYGFWLSHALKEYFYDRKSSFVSRHANVLNEKAVDDLFADTTKGKADNSFLLWKLLNLFIWADKYECNFEYSRSI